MDQLFSRHDGPLPSRASAIRFPRTAPGLFLWMALFLAADALAAEATIHWPSFRGPGASGVAVGSETPAKWDKPKWKTPIPGLAHSCPIIWGDRIFLTTAVTSGGDENLRIGLYGDIAPVQETAAYSWQLLCLDKADGAILWTRTAHEGLPRIKRHPKSSHANPTPATDGRRVVAFFGPEGLFCYDMEGKLQWRMDFGKLDSGFFMVPDAQWGFASSPVIHDGKVFIQCDVQTNSFVAAFNLEDGQELWRTARRDVPTWSTPAIDPARPQVIVNGFRHMGGYDLLTGKALWKLDGGGDIPVPTPVIAHSLVFLTSAHGRLSPIYAVRLDATGDITLEPGETSNQFVPWSIPRGGNYMQTPIVVGEYLYACKDNGVVTCFKAKTGEEMFSERLGTGRSGFTASPVAAAGKIYFTSEEGTVHVLKAASEFELLAKNDLGEPSMATPAISENTLYFRTRHHLLAVGPQTSN